MKAYSLIVFAAILGALLWTNAFLGVPQLARYSSISHHEPHIYDGTSTIANIDLLVVYFVPKDRVATSSDIWIPSVQSAIDDLVTFHAVQFQHKSLLHVRLETQAITGERSSLEYDTNDTNRGNPSALRSIGDELVERLSVGDLKSLLKTYSGTMPRLFVVYEGVGSSGSPGGAALINRKFLTDSEYAYYGHSYFAHEFYHTIGIPDGFNDADQSFTPDIMGLGRRRTLRVNFVAPETLRHCGL